MKQIIRALTEAVNAKIIIPGSKSITNRALLLAALAEGVSNIKNVLISDDTVALMDALQQLGIHLQLDRENNVCVIEGCSGRFRKSTAQIWCDSAGTVARFLLAVCAAMPGKFSFDGTRQLRERPIAGLLRVLTRQGAAIAPADATHMPFEITGADYLSGGGIEIDGSATGQFVSALLMAAPFAKSATTLKVQDLVSRSFVTMTCDMMAEFGVKVRRLPQDRFSVLVPQRYMARDYVIEPDLSTASYFFAVAAMTAGRVQIQPLALQKSKQGDAKFLEILRKMGCSVTENAEGLTVSGPAQLNGVSVNMRDCSDTFMTLAALAPFALTPTTITNIGHTRLQESDRITVMRTELEKLGVRAEEGPDWLRIYPSQPHGGVIDPHQDHRIAMSFAILGLRVSGIEIMDADCVGKTCPKFFEMLRVFY